MKQKNVKIVAIVIALVMILSVLAGALSSIAFATQSELEKAEAELKELKAETATIEKELANIEKTRANTYSQIEALDKQIDSISAEIRATEKLLVELDSDIEAQEKLLEEATIKAEEQYELYKTRVRVMYESSETSYLEILLSADNFFDALSRMEVTRQIMAYDEKIFDDYLENVAIIDNAKQALEDNKATKETEVVALEERSSSLEATQKKAESTLKALIDQENSAETKLDQAAAAEEAMANTVANLAKQLVSEDVYVGGTYLWPVAGYTSISSPYGYRTHPISGTTNSMHKGIDVPAPSGTPVRAANSGTVIVSTYSSSYGNYIMIDHGGGNVTLYAHLVQRYVGVGDSVSQGSSIGGVGTTGASTGNHLHFETIVNGSHQNPMNYFS